MSWSQPCPYCGTQVRPNARFCGGCGRCLPVTPPGNVQCPVCGQPNRLDAHYCAYCRAALPPGPPPAASPPHVQPRRLSGWIWAALGVALFLILAGGAWALTVTRPDPAPPPGPTPTTETVGQASTPTPTTEADTRPVGTEPGQRAPDFVLDDLEGRTHRLVDYRGQVLILDFWATWCGFCQKQLPILQNVSEKYTAEDLAILALDQKEPARTVADYRDQNGIDLTMLLDVHGQVGNDYGARALPTLYFVNREGVIHAKSFGLMDQAGVEAQVEAMLSQAARP